MHHLGSNRQLAADKVKMVKSTFIRSLNLTFFIHGRLGFVQKKYFSYTIIRKLINKVLYFSCIAR